MATRAEIIQEFAKDPATARATLERITQIVAKSFADDRQESSIILLSAQRPSAFDIKHRTNIAYDWFIRLRGDLHYSTDKALDFLPKAVRSALDGVDWEPPPATKSWGGSEASR